ncbi:MAG: hypothetical protein K2W82_16390 [Candidatus Obscuribacterales bacterium]|nr:hypothetical protein [Candidatus Obscuribacterales bacterium]
MIQKTNLRLTMREHQIVINLKPEQFLRLQQLARSVGAKSLGAFARQQLLRALAIEQEDTEGGEFAPVNNQLLIDELKRLQGELKAFADESLSIPLPMVENKSSSAPFRLPHTPLADDLEELADQTFAISPRLGALDSSWRRDKQSQVEEPSLPLKDPLNDLLGPAEGPSLIAEAEVARLIAPAEVDQPEKEMLTESVSQKVEDKPVLTKPVELESEVISAKPLPEPDITSETLKPPASKSSKTPLGSPDEDLPLSGGPPPKRR